MWQWYVGLKHDINLENVTALFTGTARETKYSDTFLAVTFEVDRVWKGDIPKQIVVYRPAPLPGVRYGGQPVQMHFEFSTRYAVLAHHLSAAERLQFGVANGDTTALAVQMCGGGSRPVEIVDAEDWKGLGPGREPQ